MRLVPAALLLTLIACASDDLQELACVADDTCETAGSTGDATTENDPALDPVDTACDEGDGSVSFPDRPAALPAVVEAGCRTGFQENKIEGLTYTIAARAAEGAVGRVLEVDLATYRNPDVVRIWAVADGVRSLVFSSCRLQTSSSSDPTSGSERPPAATIREFRVTIPDHTTQLSFDFSDTDSPTYLRVLGLCGFVVSSPGSRYLWRAVSDE